VARKPVIVVIGAGSATFGPKLLRDVIHHPGLGGATLRFVDTDAERLDVFTRLAGKIVSQIDHDVKIESTTERREALPGADYVLISGDTARVETWKRDFRLPVDEGVRQVTGELGGPGGLFHSLRQIPLHIEMGKDCAELAPGATVMVESNPLNRICLAMRRHTECGRILGLCHGVEIIEAALAPVLGLEMEDIFTTAGGTNHFTWILDLRNSKTGEDLYPLLREKIGGCEESFHPLSRKLFDVYGCFPSCGDDHIGEYLPFAWEYVGLDGPDLDERARGTAEFWEYLKGQALSEGPVEEFSGALGGGHKEERTAFFFTPRSWVDTLAFPIIDSEANNRLRRMPAVNMLNEGAITNLPPDVFVEAPAAVDSSGCRLLSIGELPKPLAAFCRRDVEQCEMTVEAAVSGDRRAVLQAMLLDPVVDSIKTAERVLDKMLEANADYLPQFE